MFSPLFSFRYFFRPVSLNEKDKFNEAADISISGLAADSVKLVKTAAINVKVKNAQKGAKAVADIVQGLNGMITHQSIESNEGPTKELKISNDSVLIITAYTPSAVLTARIPTENLEDFIFAITDQSDFVYNASLDIEDKSLSYLSHQFQEKARTKALAIDTAKLPRRLTAVQAINISDEAINRDIARRQIDADVNYSTVSLHLTQNALIRKEVVVNNRLDEYHLPFAQRFQDALKAGAEFFLVFIVALSHFWVFILLALAAWLTWKFYRSPRKLR